MCWKNNAELGGGGADRLSTIKRATVFYGGLLQSKGISAEKNAFLLSYDIVWCLVPGFGAS